MAVYKDKKRGTWYTSFPYVDWTGKRCRKLKRGFLTKKEAQNWENHFKLQKANSLDMTFEDFYGIPFLHTLISLNMAGWLRYGTERRGEQCVTGTEAASDNRKSDSC